jgi:hypothetical protein
MRKGCAFPTPPLFIRPVFRRVKAQPSRGGKQQHFGDFGRKGGEHLKKSTTVILSACDFFRV